MKARLPRTVIALGVVSLLTDLSSEMIYPLLPVFLTATLGASAAALGIIEGVAESTSAALKLVSGVWTDRVRRRKPLVFAGYTLAGAVRPLIGLASTWPTVLALRFADRVGKGIRSSPRDALIADATTAANRGHAFGVQRAMDHAGAVAGPLLAAALLRFEGVELRHVFLLAAIPAAVVVIVLAVAVREPQRAISPAAAVPLREIWGRLDHRFRRVMIAVLLFTLGNSTDAFLLLRLTDAGLGAATVAVVWSAFHVVKMGAAYVGGRASDRVGRRPLVLAGWLWYVAVYAAFAVVHATGWLVAVFLVYGVYYGLTEPVEKAWVAELAPAEVRGAAYGVYNATVGLGSLPASLMFGVLWTVFGSPVAFAVGAGFALVAVALIAMASGRPARRMG